MFSRSYWFPFKHYLLKITSSINEYTVPRFADTDSPPIGDGNVSKDSLWLVRCINVKEQFKACYGPGWSAGVPQNDDKYNFYEFSFEKLLEEGSASLFSKRFQASEVRPDYWSWEGKMLWLSMRQTNDLFLT